MKSTERIGRAVSNGVFLCLHPKEQIRQVVSYLSPRLTVKVTRQRRPDRRAKQATLLVSIGAPNFLERRFIKACRKAGQQSWPVRKIQLKRYP